MLQISECYKAHSSIRTFSTLDDNSIAITTQTHGTKILSQNSCDILLHLPVDLVGHQTTAMAFSKESHLLAFANYRVIYIFNMQNKTLIQTIYTNEGDIQILFFIPNSHYLISGTKNGRVMQYRYDGRAHLSRLCSYGQMPSKQKMHLKNNYVSAFAFKGSLFASSGYGGIITVLRINSYINRHIITTSKVQINALCFLNDNRIVSGNIDGFVQIHSLKKHQASKTIATPFRYINNIIVMPNPRFILVSAQHKSLLLIDTHLEKIVAKEYLTFEENVLHTQLSGTHLFVSLEDNSLQKIELPTVEHLKRHIYKNELDKAYKLLEYDPSLQGTREHKRVDVMYDKLYSQAIEALIHSRETEAKELIEMFIDIPSKKEELRSVFVDFSHYSMFKSLFFEKKLMLAYAIADKHPALKHTQEYKKMEELFKDAFTYAQKQILMGRESLANDALAPYTTVSSKKSIVKLVLKQNEDFRTFLKAIYDKNHTLVEQLAEKNKLFSQIPTFMQLKNETQNSLEKIKKLIYAGKGEEAIESIQTIHSVPGISQELKELHKDAKLVVILNENYKNDDFKSCYQIIDSSYTLDNLELSKLLEAHWAKIMNECEDFALKGDIKSVKNKFGDLISVRSRIDKIGDLLRLSFHSKIKALLTKKSYNNAEKVIYSYIDIFGKDSEISSIMDLYEQATKKKLAFMQTKRVSRDAWLQSPVIMG